MIKYKLFFSVIFCFCFLTSISFSEIKYRQYCAKKSPQKTFSGVLSSACGFNFLSKKVIEHEITKILKKELNSKFDVSIENFYGLNILDGEFKTLKAHSNQVMFNDFYISDLSAQTLCDYNFISYKNNELIFRENFILKYSSKITQDDLNKTVNSNEYKKIIDKMNKNEYISSLLQIKTSKILIQNNNILLNYSIIPFPKISGNIVKNVIKPLNLSIKSNISVKDNKIELCDFQINSKKFSYLSSFLLSKFNPLEYNIKISKNQKSNLIIDNAIIRDNIIHIDGYLFVPKDNKGI